MLLSVPTSSSITLGKVPVRAMGTFAPIIPVTSRPRRKSGGEKPCGMAYSHVIWLRCEALSLSHGPRVGFNDLQLNDNA